MNKQYILVVPISGNAGTRNPIAKYASYLGLCEDRFNNEIILETKEELKRTLKARKKQNRELYKQAFVAKRTN